jgi:hypothetical protein
MLENRHVFPWNWALFFVRLFGNSPYTCRAGRMSRMGDSHAP